jgi:adiponectin receptor
LEGLQGKYSKYELDASISRAYSTLQNVREACSTASEDLRAMLLIEIVETSYPAYKEMLPTFDSLEAKAFACVNLLEGFLGDLEHRAYAMKDAGVYAFDESWKIAEGSLKSARELVDDSIEKAKESLKQSISYAKQQARERGLIRYEDLPTPWRGNPHILKGYRFSETTLDCLASVFKWTNEFVNIWSHAIGFVLVLALAFYFFPNSVNYLRTTNLDVFFVALFFVAACKCLICSCMWHTMNSIADQTIMERFACVDYTGISLLIAASIMTTEHIAFYCDPLSRWIYITATGVLGLVGIMVPWHPFFNRPEKSWLRVAFFVTLGATGFAPVVQLNIIHGAAWVYYFYAPITKSLIVYLVGAFIYAMKIPEQYLPGWFDYFGGSHNIWHFAVLGGIIFHYNAMSEMFTGAIDRAASECPNLYIYS